MAMQRIFLDWQRPGLESATEFFDARFGRGRAIDLSEVVVVVPVARAGRRLLECLVERAATSERILTPPEIVTVGRLPELLYEPRRPFADALTQQLAWVESLKELDASALGAILAEAPAASDLSAWLALGEMLARLHRELAADALDFRAVLDAGSNLDGFTESRRWEVLADAQQKYLRVLDGLELWDLQTARLFAIRYGECKCARQIVLLGAVDLNRAQRMMLDQVRECVTALVVAPESLGKRFDEHGCLVPTEWAEAHLEIAEEQIEVVEGPAEQATAVVRALAALEGRYAAAEVTIGVPDDTLVPLLEQRLAESGTVARFGPGVPVEQTLPYRFLAATAMYLDGRRFSDFATLARLPQISQRIEDAGLSGDWLTPLDCYATEHLPLRLDGSFLGRGETTETVRRVHAAVETLLDGLEGKRLLCHWASPMLELLGRAFGGRTLHSEREPDRTIIEACRLLRDAAAGLAAMPEKLCPIVSAAEAMQLLLGQVAGGNIAAPAGDDTIELLGWLELPLDDAPVLVITSLNEGVIPSSRNADMFLPNQLRRQLGVEDNERRYARDAYSLSVLLASRARLHLVAARRNADGDPRMPSRLLFACPPKTIAERALRFFRPERIEARPLGVLRPGTGPVFTPPRPAPLPKPVEAMSVTEFRDYLACPYRYYLRRRLRLEQVSDVAEELDGGQFGSLVHAVLGDFGLGKKRDSHDPDEIDAFLIVALERHAEKQYGRAPRAAVRVQLEQLKRRLHAFAVWQAGHAAEGWHIECVEVSPPEGSAKLRVDNKDMILHGRIDRIDHHDDGRRLLLDYKTADKAADPDTAHRHGQEWIDLQLPLYRHLLDGLKLEPPTVGEVLLGYIVLPKNASGASLVLGPWAQADLDAADAAAATVVRGVRGEKFWPPARPAPKYFDEFAAICLDDQLLRRVTETEETEAAAGGEAE